MRDLLLLLAAPAHVEAQGQCQQHETDCPCHDKPPLVYLPQLTELMAHLLTSLSGNSSSSSKTNGSIKNKKIQAFPLEYRIWANVTIDIYKIAKSI